MKIFSVKDVLNALLQAEAEAGHGHSHAHGHSHHGEEGHVHDMSVGKLAPTEN